MSRRRRMSGVEQAGEVPVVLTAAGVSADLWRDPERTEAWCVQRGLPAPPAVFHSSPRALRDHCAVSWSTKHFPHERFHGPDWGASARAGVGPISSARMVARRAAVDA